MGITDYARHRGVRLQAVQYALKAGRIHRDTEGKIDSDRADQEWQRNTLHSNARYGPKPPRNGHAGAASHAARVKSSQEAEAFAEPERMGQSLDYSKARAARELYEARIKKLDFEERSGSLLPRRAVELAAFNRFRVLRDACFNVPNRLSAQLAAEPEASAIHDLLEAEIRQIFEEFADGKLV
jgi:hypothetical protein